MPFGLFRRIRQWWELRKVRRLHTEVRAAEDYGHLTPRQAAGLLDHFCDPGQLESLLVERSVFEGGEGLSDRERVRYMALRETLGPMQASVILRAETRAFRFGGIVERGDRMNLDSLSQRHVYDALRAVATPVQAAAAMQNAAEAIRRVEIGPRTRQVATDGERWRINSAQRRNRRIQHILPCLQCGQEAETMPFTWNAELRLYDRDICPFCGYYSAYKDEAGELVPMSCRPGRPDEPERPSGDMEEKPPAGPAPRRRRVKLSRD